VLGAVEAVGTLGAVEAVGTLEADDAVGAPDAGVAGGGFVVRFCRHALGGGPTIG